jgi:hypothetical protein
MKSSAAVGETHSDLRRAYSRLGSQLLLLKHLPPLIETGRPPSRIVSSRYLYQFYNDFFRSHLEFRRSVIWCRRRIHAIAAFHRICSPI